MVAWKVGATCMGHASVDPRELRGVIPPMVTPFTTDDRIDRALLGIEARYLLNSRVNGIVVGGSTGEGAGMSAAELHEAISIVVDTVEGAIPVIGGVIADRSEEAVRLGAAAKKAGACALQVPPPNFHFVTAPEVLSRYYRAIIDGTGMPLIIYNVIPWAQVAIEALERITAENPDIIGIKQSGGNMHGLATLLAYMKGRLRIYSAIDDLVYPSLVLGADGTISGTSSVFPRETVEIWNCVQNGDHARALDLHNALVPVWRTLDGPQFPSRVKYALALLGRTTGKPRSPFTWPEAEDASRIETALRRSEFLATESRAALSER